MARKKQKRGEVVGLTEEFEQLYRDYFQFIYLYALSLTRDEDLAEEITQETFFRAMEHIDRFGKDYRVADKEGPVKALNNRTVDNVEIGRKKS